MITREDLKGELISNALSWSQHSPSNKTTIEFDLEEILQYIENKVSNAFKEGCEAMQ